MNGMNQHNLDRFLDAQDSTFETALKEIASGQKRSHWIWFIFPQVRGLGNSEMAQRYAIRSKCEAVAYLQHEILGNRLRQSTAALLAHAGKNITDIMGHPDDVKLRSSMTLFAAISPPNNVFSKVLAEFYSGTLDNVTIELLKNHP